METYNTIDRDFGAINIKTNEYALARYSIKSEKYKCPCCDEILQLKKGNKRRHHWAHYSQDSKCQFYKSINNNNNNEKIHESLLHKECKSILQNILKSTKQINVYRCCATKQCDMSMNYRINPLDDNTQLVIEYNMTLNDRKIRPDLVKIESNKVIEIYEIFATHQTQEEDRPFNINWYEFKADEIYELYNDIKYKTESSIELNCHRHTIKCNECIEKEQILLMKMGLENERKKKQKEEELKLKRTTCQTCKSKKQDNNYPNCYNCNIKNKIQKICKICKTKIYVKNEWYDTCWDCNNKFNKINETNLVF